MKRLLLPAVALLALSLVACGNSSRPPSANGAWSAALSTSAGQQLGTFTFNMTQSSTTLTASNMNFSGLGNLSQCFGAGTTMSGSMASGMMNGGTMTMTMSWAPPGGTATNTMTMQGSMASGMGSGSGTFTLTGQTSGCTSQSGTFTMTRMSNSMM